MSLVLSGRNILPAVLNIGTQAQKKQELTAMPSPFEPHAENQKHVTSTRPGIIVILQCCGSKVIHKFLVHGQCKVRMIRLAALGRSSHKAK